MEEFYFNFQELFAANVVKIIENKIYYAIFGVYTFFFFNRIAKGVSFLF